jgi:hypothetical protein
MSLAEETQPDEGEAKLQEGQVYLPRKSLQVHFCNE